MSSERSNPPVEPARHASAATASPAVGLIGLFAVILGGILMAYGFVAGINAAFDGSGGGAGVFILLFIVGGILVVAGLVFAIVRLVQRRNRVLAVLTLVIGLLPVIGVIALRVAALS